MQLKEASTMSAGVKSFSRVTFLATFLALFPHWVTYRFVYIKVAAKAHLYCPSLQPKLPQCLSCCLPCLGVASLPRGNGCGFSKIVLSIAPTK